MSGLRNSERTIFFLSIRAILISLLILISTPGSGRPERPDEEITRYKNQKLSIKWDPMTQAPLIMRGVESDLLELKDISKLSRREISYAGPRLVSKYQSLLQIAPDQLRLKGAEKISENWYVSYWQTFHSLILYESSLGFSIDARGRIRSLGALVYPGVQAPAISTISYEKALEIGKNQIKEFKKLNCRLLAESTLIYPLRKKDSIEYFRVYAFNFFPEKALHPASTVGGWAVFVDSQTGKVVLHETLLKPMGCCVPEDWAPPKSEEMKPKW